MVIDERWGAAVAIAVGLLGGALTAYAQGALPAQLGSIANSAGSWALVGLTVALLGRNRTASALGGALTLASLLTGYVVTDAWRGLPSSHAMILFWSLAAVVAGPVIGLAAWWLRRGTPAYLAISAGGIAGLLIGEGLYGMTYLAQTTYPSYWLAEVGVGGALLVTTSLVRLRGAPAVLAVLVASAVTTAFILVYRLDLIALP